MFSVIFPVSSLYVRRGGETGEFFRVLLLLVRLVRSLCERWRFTDC